MSKRKKPMPGPQPCNNKVDVLKAQSWMSDIINNNEHCWMDPDLASGCSLVVGQQCRLKRNSSNYAIYTISSFYEDGTDNDDVRMGLVGRQKLGTSNSMKDIDLFADILRSDLNDADAEEQSEFVERLDDDGSHASLVACAPHGGMIENYTDEQAERVASQLAAKNVSSWRCKGWKSGGGAFDRWHITSTEISRLSFPLLDSIGDRGFQYAVSFHGQGASGILIGGGGPAGVKDAIKTAIEAVVAGSGIDVTVAQPDDLYSGDNPANLVNWLTANGSGGVQIEQEYAARRDFGIAIADAVAGVFDGLI